MQYINLTKVLEIESEIEDLLLISIDDQIDTTYNQDGVQLTGKIIVSGNAKTSDGNKNFYEEIDLDVFLLNEEIEERNKLEIEINDFNYTIEGNKLNLEISLKLLGLKEITTTFPTKEDNESIIQEEIEEDREVLDTEDEIIQENDLKEEIDVKETNKPSLLKSVFANKRIKEEVSWKLHCVKLETSYEEIAKIYGVNINKLKNINNNEKISEGKLIFIPMD